MCFYIRAASKGTDKINVDINDFSSQIFGSLWPIIQGRHSSGCRLMSPKSYGAEYTLPATIGSLLELEISTG